MYKKLLAFTKFWPKRSVPDGTSGTDLEFDQISLKLSKIEQFQAVKVQPWLIVYSESFDMCLNLSRINQDFL